MTRENTLSIELISGAYSSILWEGIESVFYDVESLINIHDALEALYDGNNDKEAFGLVCALYDIVGLVIPEDILELAVDDEARKEYIRELIADIESMI